MFRRSAVFASLVVAIMITHSYAGDDANWGDFSGQLVYGGAPPVPAPVAAPAGICAGFAPVDESVLVDPKTKGLANVVVYMYLKKDAKPPEVHPSYAKTATDTIPFDNNRCQFSPRIVGMRTTQILGLGNKDATGHNVKGDCLVNAAFNPIIPANANLDIKLPEPERLPVSVSCTIHPHMKGFVLVKDNPYFAVTDKEGKFKIKNVPKGEWVFQFWHEKIGYVKDVEIDGGKVAWKKGRLPVQIAAAGKDLGVVTVADFKNK